jgi:hypothetical protein
MTFPNGIFISKTAPQELIIPKQLHSLFALGFSWEEKTCTLEEKPFGYSFLHYDCHSN